MALWQWGRWRLQSAWVRGRHAWRLDRARMLRVYLFSSMTKIEDIEKAVEKAFG